MRTFAAPMNMETINKEKAIRLSGLIMRMATHVICHTLVDYQDLLKDERMSIAHAFLQRATSTHLCNHKLTVEGIVYKYKNQPFLLPEEYKTMTLTRTVYEHLAMFFFLFHHPRTVVERDIAWKYWQINSKKNLLDYCSDDDETSGDQQRLTEEIETLRQQILTSHIGVQCHQKLDQWTALGSPGNNGGLQFVVRGGRYDVRRIPYSQAWRFLFDNRDMAQFYSYLSIHCHPVFDGLRQYQEQADGSQEEEGVPLYFSCCFLAQLCALFLRQIPGSETILKSEFNRHELSTFHTLSQLPKDKKPRRSKPLGRA